MPLECLTMADKRKQKTSQRRRMMRGLLAFVLLAAGIIWLLLYAAEQERSRLRQAESLPVARAPFDSISRHDIAFGRGYSGVGWQLYFTEPAGKSPSTAYRDGVDSVLAAEINQTRDTLDVAVYELDSPTLTDAILDAHRRGVAVRIVADDEQGLHSEDNGHLRDLQAAGVAVVDDGRSGLMHNKFMILDARRVWTGSWNYTINGAYRNNNNAFVMDGARAAGGYQAEFDEMFLRGEFGSRSTDDGMISFDLGESAVSVMFAPEADELPILLEEIAGARQSIRFMTFVFSLDELAEAMLWAAAEYDVSVRGIFEKRNSTASWSQLPVLYCAGMGLRQDGNYYSLHHKVIIIDERVVITGSFNFSNSAVKRNDENLVIIRDAGIAALYLDEWQRLWDGAAPIHEDDVNCG